MEKENPVNHKVQNSILGVQREFQSSPTMSTENY